MCVDLHDTFREDVISLKPHLAITKQAFPEPSVAQSPADMPEEPLVAQFPLPIPEEAFPGPEFAQSPDAIPPPPGLMPDVAIPEPSVVVQSPTSMPDLSIERLRHHEGNVGSNTLSEIMPSSTRFPSSIRVDFTPGSTTDIGSELDPRVGTDFGTRSLPTPGFSSAGTFGSDLETPVIYMEQLGLENTGLSDIPELMNSAEDVSLSVFLSNLSEIFL